MNIIKKISSEEIIISLIIFSIFLNFEFNIFEIISEGERIRNSFNLLFDQGKKVNYTTLNIPLNLLDIIFVISLLHISYFRRKEFFYYISNIINNNIQRKILIIFLILFMYIFVILIYKKSNFSNSQFIVQFLHFLKLFQCFLFFFIIIFLINNSHIERLIKFLIIVNFLFSIFGILHTSSIINISNIIDNRMTYGGILILNYSILPLLSLSKKSLIYKNKHWKITLLISVFTSVLYCLTCGKRAIYFISILIIIISVITIFTYRKKIIREANFLIFILAFPLLTHTLISIIVKDHKLAQSGLVSDLFSVQYSETFLDKPIPVRELNPQYRLISMNLCRHNIKETFKVVIEIDNFKKLTHKDLDQISQYDEIAYQKIKDKCFLFNIDHSSIIRLSKHVKSFILLYDNFLGVGFWGIQYEYNFLPDSGLQFFLEIGLIGMLISFLLIFYLIKYFSLEKLGDSVVTFLPVNLIFISFFTLSFFSSILYEWRYILLLSIFTYLIVKKIKIN